MEIQSIDLREQRCPMALLLAKRACALLAHGEKIELYVSDSGALRDIPCYLESQGFIVLQRTVHGAMVFHITKQQIVNTK